MNNLQNILNRFDEEFKEATPQNPFSFKQFLTTAIREAQEAVIDEIPDSESDEFTGDSVTLKPLKQQLRDKFLNKN